MTSTATARKSSLYTLRVTTPAEAALVAVALQDLNPRGVQDHGPAHVGFRATNDEAATQIATVALEAAGLTAVAATLTTGLGVHLRTVAVQDAGADQDGIAHHGSAEPLDGPLDHATEMARMDAEDAAADVPHVITRDGAVVSIHPSEAAAFGVLLRLQPMSTDWAIQHEGYSIEPATHGSATIAINAWGDEHPYRTHKVSRAGDHLTCDTCASQPVYLPSLPRTPATGIAASASRFD